MKPRKETNTATLAVIGIDIGKEVFHIVGLAVDGKIAFRRKIRCLGFEDAFEKLPASIVGMETCLSAHFCQQSAPRIGARAADHPDDLRQTLRQGAEEPMPRRSPRQRCDRTCAWSKRRAKTSSICRLVIASGPDLVSRRTATISQIRAFLIEQGIAVGAGAQ
jgi:hypothetical protein